MEIETTSPVLSPKGIYISRIVSSWCHETVIHEKKRKEKKLNRVHRRSELAWESC